MVGAPALALALALHPGVAKPTDRGRDANERLCTTICGMWWAGYEDDPDAQTSDGGPASFSFYANRDQTVVYGSFSPSYSDMIPGPNPSRWMAAGWNRERQEYWAATFDDMYGPRIGGLWLVPMTMSFSVGDGMPKWVMVWRFKTGSATHVESSEQSDDFFYRSANPGSGSPADPNAVPKSGRLADLCALLCGRWQWAEAPDPKQKAWIVSFRVGTGLVAQAEDDRAEPIVIGTNSRGELGGVLVTRNGALELSAVRSIRGQIEASAGITHFIAARDGDQLRVTEEQDGVVTTFTLRRLN